VAALLMRQVRLGEAASWLTLAATLVVAPMLSCAAWGALALQASSAALGEEVGVETGWRTALRRAPALWVQGVSLLVLWSLFTLFSTGGIGTAGALLAMLGPAGVVLAVVIWVAAGVAGQLAFLALVFAAPLAVVLEGRGPFDAIGRSMDLVRGAIPRTMSGLGACVVIAVLPVVGVSGVASLVTSGPAATALGSVAATLAGALALPFLACSLTLFYYDRRVREEALDVRLLAEGLAAH
jgi:hypothetical protein